MPIGNPNFTHAYLKEQADGSKLLSTVGVTPPGTEQITGVRVTVIAPGGWLRSELDETQTGSDWKVDFDKLAAASKIDVGTKLQLIGTVMRAKESYSKCDCPQPESIIWDEVVIVEAGK